MTNTLLAPALDHSMRAAFKRGGVPLWVPPTEVSDYLRSNNWCRDIVQDICEWFARRWSLAFVAGYLGTRCPTVDASSAHRMLTRMGYSTRRADELIDLLVQGLPGLYKKGCERRSLVA